MRVITSNNGYSEPLMAEGESAVSLTSLSSKDEREHIVLVNNTILHETHHYLAQRLDPLDHKLQDRCLYACDHVQY
jgi:hypothetical protein